MACVAITLIPQGMYSKRFDMNEISENSEHGKLFRGKVKPNFPLQVGVTPAGEMDIVSQHPLSIFWPKFIDLASDCHEQNVILCRCPITPRTLVLQTTREILVGQSLQLWFSEELMMTDLGIPPYLSPFNIQAENSYVCNECHEKFERPNQLKLHLALHCDKLSSEVIWTRLQHSKSSTPYLNSSFLVKTPAATTLTSGYSIPLVPLSPTISTSSPSSSTLFRPYPLSPQYPHQSMLHAPTPNLFNNNNKGFPSDLASSTSTISSSTPSPIIGIGVDAAVEDSDREMPANSTRTETGTNGRNSMIIQEQHHQHARLEAIVSNMGKAKNGHVCLYCGKLYSRKYGLKIHIRTHTGYKPLRCKICHRPFGDPSNLNKHLRLHADGSTPYRCELCRKVLVRRRDLDRHMRTRHEGHDNHHHQNGSSTRTNGNSNGAEVSEGLVVERQHQQPTSRSSTVTSTMVSSSII